MLITTEAGEFVIANEFPWLYIAIGAGAKATMGRVDLGHAPASGSRSYYEIKYRGPDNQVIDITASGWIGTQ